MAAVSKLTPCEVSSATSGLTWRTRQIRVHLSSSDTAIAGAGPDRWWTMPAMGKVTGNFKKASSAGMLAV
eukprot:CAMPEP_0197632166 /NCGR_PEP_ID=MMETSP1338-20131121/9046_1 /TAXON_ID=43686 ORGANISM="Pelagodinium beii, Strain RCC1491" /NCGR_SAMPLE_ID=MMETSP1338 /ASSEMBLY_ACC=CAM_ASM_000754 /LENGTH=69 /DNA_ID=CAMNT_0043203717 /DNA_START=151 /DNA_END=360 /DNA_ORIENTATION=-